MMAVGTYLRTYLHGKMSIKVIVITQYYIDALSLSCIIWWNRNYVQIAE